MRTANLRTGRRIVPAAFLLALLAACSRPPPPPPVDQAVVPELPATASKAAEQAAVAEQPLPSVVEAAASSVSLPLVAAVEAVEAQTATTPAPLPPEDACARVAASLIVRWEVTSPAFYTRRLIRPIWPGGASGVTWGVGYDGGHQTAAVIIDDWLVHADRVRLGGTTGLRGTVAKNALPSYRDILVPYPMAEQVFRERTMIEYRRRTARAFRDGFDDLRPTACGALVSLVYNRGAAMSGDSRREMRALRDDCIPKQDYSCIAAQLRSMKRLWRGTVNERGLSARREAEAQLAESP